MRHISNRDAAVALAHEILGARTRPLILISSTSDGTFEFDPEMVAREIATEADVVTIATGEATYALTTALPEKSQVFAGAARSYPANFGADPDWHRSILRFPDKHNLIELVEDALAQGTPSDAPVSEPRRYWAKAAVERVSGASGNVARLENGERVIVVADNIPAHFSLADALFEGEAVEGWLTDRDLAPEPAEIDFTPFEDGCVSLARVVKVTARRGYMTLHPAAEEIVLRRRDVIPGADDGENEEVEVSDILQVGHTVRVRVKRSGAALGLSVIDVDDDTNFVEPLSLLKGGAPWLREGVNAVLRDEEVTGAASNPPKAADVNTDTDADTPDRTVASYTEPATNSQVPAAPTTPVPTVGATDAALAMLRDEVYELRGSFGRLSRELRAGTDLETLDQLRDECAGLSAELHRTREQNREYVTTIAQLRRQLREAPSAAPAERAHERTTQDAWPDGEDWLRYEVHATWATRTIASDKSRYPLNTYTVGPKLLDSLGALDEGQLEKALRAIVDVLTGRAAELHGRKVHRLRQGQGGSDPYVVRLDGAQCWRASIETKAPSARRLHYWQLPGGQIELSRVVVHDDVEP